MPSPLPNDPFGFKLSALLGRLQGRQHNLDTGVAGALSIGRRAQDQIERNRASDALSVLREQARNDAQGAREADILRQLQLHEQNRGDILARFQAEQDRLAQQYADQQAATEGRYQETSGRLKDQFEQTHGETARHNRAMEAKTSAPRPPNPITQAKASILDQINQKAQETQNDAENMLGTDEQAPDILKQLNEERERVLGIRAPKAEPGPETDPRKLAALQSALIKLKQIEDLRKAQGLGPDETPSVTPAEAKAGEHRQESQTDQARKEYEAKLNSLYEEAKDAVLKPRMGHMPTDPDSAARVEAKIEEQFRARLKAAGITDVDAAVNDFKNRLPAASKRAGGKGGPGGEGGPAQTGEGFPGSPDAPYRSLADLKRAEDQQLTAERQKAEADAAQEQQDRQIIADHLQRLGVLAGPFQTFADRGLFPPGTPPEVQKAFLRTKARDWKQRGVLGKTEMGINEAIGPPMLLASVPATMFKAGEEAGVLPRMPIGGPPAVVNGSPVDTTSSLGLSDVANAPAIPFVLSKEAGERLKEAYPETFKKGSTASEAVDLGSLLVPLLAPFVLHSLKPSEMEAARAKAQDIVTKLPDDALARLRVEAAGSPEAKGLVTILDQETARRLDRDRGGIFYDPEKHPNLGEQLRRAEEDAKPAKTIPQAVEKVESPTNPTISQIDESGLSPEAFKQRQTAIFETIGEDLGNLPPSAQKLSPTHTLHGLVEYAVRSGQLDNVDILNDILREYDNLIKVLETNPTPELRDAAAPIHALGKEMGQIRDWMNQPQDRPGPIDLNKTPELPPAAGRVLGDQMGAVYNATGEAVEALHEHAKNLRKEELLRRYETLDPTRIREGIAGEKARLEREGQAIAKDSIEAERSFKEQGLANPADLDSVRLAEHILNNPDEAPSIIASLEAPLGQTLTDLMKKAEKEGWSRTDLEKRFVEAVGESRQRRREVQSIVDQKLRTGKKQAERGPMADEMRDLREKRLDKVFMKWSVADVNRITPEITGLLNEPFVKFQKAVEGDLAAVRDATKNVAPVNAGWTGKLETLLGRDRADREMAKAMNDASRALPPDLQAVARGIEEARNRLLVDAYGNDLVRQPDLAKNLDDVWSDLLDKEGSALKAYEKFSRYVRKQQILKPALEEVQRDLIPRYQGVRRFYAEKVIQMIENGAQKGELVGPLSNLISQQFARAAFILNPAPWVFNVLFSAVSNFRQLPLRDFAKGLVDYVVHPGQWKELQAKLADLGLQEIRPEPLGAKGWRKFLGWYDKLFGPMEIGDAVTKGMGYLGARSEMLRVGQELVKEGRLRPEQLDAFVAANVAEHVRRTQQVNGPLNVSPNVTEAGPLFQFGRSAFAELNGVIRDALVDGAFKGNIAPVLKHAVIVGALGTIAAKMGFSLWKKFLLSTVATSPLLILAEQLMKTPDDVQNELLLGGGILSTIKNAGQALAPVAVGLSGAPVVEMKRVSNWLIPPDSEFRTDPEGWGRKLEQLGIIGKARPEPIEINGWEQARRLLVGNNTRIRELEGLVYDLRKKIQNEQGDESAIERDASRMELLLDQLDRIESETMRK